MKRLGTTPRRRPTVACQPTIGHRTPRAAQFPEPPAPPDINIRVPVVELPDGFIGVNFTDWNRELPSNMHTQSMSTNLTPALLDDVLRSTLTNGGYTNIHTRRDLPDGVIYIMAKRPTSHAPSA